MTRRVDPPIPALAQALRGATIATFVLAIVGLTPGRVGDVAGAIAVGMVVAAPLLRVLWLMIRWARARDARFAAMAAALLVIVLGGAALAAASS